MAKKQGDFGYHISRYLTAYLSGTKNSSPNTIHSYRDTFKLLITYCDEAIHTPADRLQVKSITPSLVSGFIEWLKSVRGNSVSTANLRLAAIHGFFRYLQYREPQYLLQCQQILGIEMARVKKPMVGYLSTKDLQTIFEQIDESTRHGRRDSVLLHLLYDSGARVQELCDLKVRDVYLNENPHVLLHGKGNKERYAPIVTDTAQRLERYISENGLNRPGMEDSALFVNQQRNKLSRAGVAHIIKKYADAARAISPRIPENVTPHIFRHTKAMHLCQAGIELSYIQDILGHENIETTEIYAKLNVELLRDALENAYPELPAGGLPDWREDDSLLTFLNSL